MKAHPRRVRNGAADPRLPPELAARFRLLGLAAFVSAADRFVVAAMLVAIARDLNVTLAAATVAASVYFLCYGASQLGWAALSDRLGRVRTMRLTLAGAALGGVASALAPTLLVLVVARAITGAAFAAVVPTTLVYVGDSLPIAAQRPGPLNHLVRATAFGNAAATLGAGAAAAFTTWRLGFAAPALLAAYLVYRLARIPEPPHQAGRRNPLRQFTHVVRRPRALLVIALALVEGAVVTGCITFLAPALEQDRVSAALAGAVVAVYGIAVVVCSGLIRKLATSGNRRRLMATGGVAYVSAYALAALTHAVAAVVVTALLLGVGWAFMHPALQAWATEVAPRARATAIGMFATALFVGAAVASGLAAPLAGAQRYGTIFAIAAVMAALLTTAAFVATSRRLSPEEDGRSSQPGSESIV